MAKNKKRGKTKKRTRRVLISRKKKTAVRKTLLRAKKPKQKPRYLLNHGFEFFYELRDLILKSSPAEKDNMIKRINKLGKVKLAVAAGIFVNKENSDPAHADLLLVGEDIENAKLKNFLRALEAEVGKEIKFAVMDGEEFKYRWAMFDRFIRVMLEGPHEKLINKLAI